MFSRIISFLQLHTLIDFVSRYTYVHGYIVTTAPY